MTTIKPEDVSCKDELTDYMMKHQALGLLLYGGVALGIYCRINNGSASNFEKGFFDHFLTKITNGGVTVSFLLFSAASVGVSKVLDSAYGCVFGSGKDRGVG